MPDYLETADVWTVLDLIAAEFTSDPMSTQCFDLRLVRRTIQLNEDHRRAVRGEPMQFFGVWGVTRPGHFVHDEDGNTVRPQHQIVSDGDLDGKMPPRLRGEPEDVVSLVYYRGATILAMWDRSADDRGQCNAAFIQRGTWSRDDMMAEARRLFPTITARLKAFNTVASVRAQ